MIYFNIDKLSEIVMEELAVHYDTDNGQDLSITLSFF